MKSTDVRRAMRDTRRLTWLLKLIEARKAQAVILLLWNIECEGRASLNRPAIDRAMKMNPAAR